MTVIVGLETPKGVYMGCDSSAVGEWSITPVTISKIIQFENLLIGYTGSFRMGQLIENKLEIIPHSTKNDLDYIFVVVESIIKCLQAGQYTLKENEQISGAGLLIAYKKGLYLIGDDYGITRSGYSYNALGYGYAKGALAVTESKQPYDRIDLALRVSAKHCAYVCSPFHIFEPKDKGWAMTTFKEGIS